MALQLRMQMLPHHEPDRQAIIWGSDLSVVVPFKLARAQSIHISLHNIHTGSVEDRFYFEHLYHSYMPLNYWRNENLHNLEIYHG